MYSKSRWLHGDVSGAREILAKARSDLEKARIRNPRIEELWLESVRLEIRSGFRELASERLARALQECEGSGKYITVFSALRSS
ncbi:hypothetical protein KIN20_015315 [Parelaphostrongylus tenuis]|uniref:Uncharacterized protein n=1 Tax=Parelaphostrongylus tenuis TaxID=148309 RepID=A0AAD5MYA9_PARTN|nr:hypothetical protein KIN20_015315 [Parelaphostrongylus tenuis]